MRSSNRFICICVLAGLAVVLAGVPAAQADEILTAPSLSLTTATAAGGLNPYTLTIGTNGLNGPDAVNSYNLHVTLVGPAGLTFGTAVSASPNVLDGLLGTTIAYSGSSTLTDVAGSAGGDASPNFPNNQTTLVVGVPKGLITIPLNYVPGAVGTWTVTWDSSQTNFFDYGGNEPTGGYQFHNGTIVISEVVSDFPRLWRPSVDWPCSACWVCGLGVVARPNPC